MKKASCVCFVFAGVTAFAATLSLAQTVYQNQMCISTPAPPCSNQCGCPIPNAWWDFCLGGIPPNGQDVITFYYCQQSTGYTCTAPAISCLDTVMNCYPCGCCGSGTNPPCPGVCWQSGCQCTQDTDKPDACGQNGQGVRYYGCTGYKSVMIAPRGEFKGFLIDETRACHTADRSPCAAVLGTTILGLVVVGQRMLPSISTDSEGEGAAPFAVKVERLSPLGSAGSSVDCESLAFVQFEYVVYNRGHVPISGLQLGTKCGCENVGSMPERVLPGESASIGFRVRAPYVGRIQRTIPLLVDGASEPVAVFDVSLRVKFEPPALVPSPNDRSITFVNGDRSPRELVLEAIEAKMDERWIHDLKLDAGDALEVRVSEVEELPEADPELIRRRYHFAVANRSLPLGPSKAIATIRTTDDAHAVKEPILIGIHVADPVAIAPNPLVIRYARGSPPPSRRVSVIHRSGHRAIATPAEFDRDLLRVEATGEQTGSVASFEVAAHEIPDSGLETKIVFDVGQNDTRELTVRFEPTDRR